MQFNKKSLMDFLGIVDKELTGVVELTAVGGTAMTLLSLKDSTMDIDFDLPGGQLESFRKVLESLHHGYKIDLYTGGLIFSQQLPEDYAEKRIPVETEFKNIKIHALHPLDIVATKIGRLNDRDIEDIRACIRKVKLTRKQIQDRAGKIEYVGDEENYKNNLRYVLENLF